MMAKEFPVFDVDLLARLDEHVQRQGRSRTSRFMAAPFAIIESRILRTLNRSRQITVPTFWGGQFCGLLPEAVTTMIRRQGYLDAAVCRAVIEFLQPGSTFLDIGAHFGFFSLLASSILGPEGKVLAFEAMPSTFGHLSSNIRRNAQFENVETFNTALGDSQGELEFFDHGLANSSLNSAFGNRGPERQDCLGVTISVPMQSLDALLADRDLGQIDLVKLDTESSEHLVLNGMAETIKRYSPTLTVELSDCTPFEAEHSARIMGILEGFGYRPFRYREGKLCKADATERIGYDNYVFRKAV